MKKAGRCIGRNVEEITLKMKTIVRKNLMIKFTKRFVFSNFNIYILKRVPSRRDLYFFFFRIYLFILFLHTYMFSVCCFRQRTYAAQGHVNRVLNTSEFKFH